MFGTRSAYLGILQRSLKIVQQIRWRHETYYDVLKLQKDCTTQEIKDAFVKLSKQYHPDVSGVGKSLESSQEFIRINEAYQTLIKPKSRLDYDSSLYTRGARPQEQYYSYAAGSIHRPWEVKPDMDPNPSPHYYGIKGLKRLSNVKVAFALTILSIIGLIVGFISIKHSFTFNRKQLDKKSAEASKHLQAVHADAKKYGNQEQLKRMMDRMLKNES